MKRMRLRYDGVCWRCAGDLGAGTSAWWDGVAKRVTCVPCHQVGSAADAPAVPVGEQAALVPPGIEPSHPAIAAPGPDDIVDHVPAPGAGRGPVPPAPTTAPPVAHPAIEPLPAEQPAAPAELDRGVPGASARAERARRSAKREDGIRTRHPKVGGLILALSDDPTSTKVWDQGAVGEERVGADLEAARIRGIEVLHDRRLPRSKANIDHLVIAPAGIWVIDAKRYLSGKLERRDVGGWFTTDLRLYVGDRDKTSLVDGVQKQIDKVRGSLADTRFEAVPVHGALCFVEVRHGWFAKPFELRGIAVTWRKHLLAPMLAPVIVDEADRDVLTRHLASWFRPS